MALFISWQLLAIQLITDRTSYKQLLFIVRIGRFRGRGDPQSEKPCTLHMTVASARIFLDN